jgi:hypothetical protein
VGILLTQTMRWQRMDKSGATRTFPFTAIRKYTSMAFREAFSFNRSRPCNLHRARLLRLRLQEHQTPPTSREQSRSRCLRDLILEIGSLSLTMHLRRHLGALTTVGVLHGLLLQLL